MFRTNLVATGIANVASNSFKIFVNATNTPPGIYNFFASIYDGVHTRYLYALGKLLLTPSRQIPAISSPRFSNGQFAFSVNGFAEQQIVLQSSTNLLQWISISTNTHGTFPLQFVDSSSTNFAQRYFRVVLLP